MKSNAENIIQGLTILKKYPENAEALCYASHDFFAFGDSEAKISDEDLKKLDELGWFISSDSDCWGTFT